jgi:hypothetical protein
VSVAPGNRLVGRILAVVDQEELERIKARTTDAHRELFTEGRPSGPPPFGYRAATGDDGRPAFLENPDQAKAVRQIYKLALAGHALQAIADKLNAAGVQPRAARFNFKDGRKVTKWQPNSVRYVLLSPSVAGLRSHRDGDGQLHLTPAKWPALVDADQWHAVQRLLGQPGVVRGVNGDPYRVRTQPRAQPRSYLLSGGRRRSGIKGNAGQGEVYGVLRCGRCGMPLVAQTQGRRVRDDEGREIRVPAYACHTKLGSDACGGVSISPAALVDDLVVRAIQRRLSISPKLRKRLDVAQDGETAQWRAERDAARARMLEAGEMFGAGTIDRATFDVMHAPARAALEHAEARLGALGDALTLPSSADVQEAWERLTLRQQRAVVERLISRIVVAPASPGLRGFSAERVGEPEWSA